MLKSSPLLSASKTQHPRLLCCCQVLPLADATGESYPSEVGLPRERRGTAVTFSRHSCEPKHVSIIWGKKNIIYTARLPRTYLDIYKLQYEKKKTDVGRGVGVWVVEVEGGGGRIKKKKKQGENNLR